MKNLDIISVFSIFAHLPTCPLFSLTFIEKFNKI
nr:MAG TPA: hypothetical protein [Caudoviricetes sp.]